MFQTRFTASLFHHPHENHVKQDWESLWIRATKEKSSAQNKPQIQTLEEDFACSTTYGRESWRGTEIMAAVITTYICEDMATSHKVKLTSHFVENVLYRRDMCPCLSGSHTSFTLHSSFISGQRSKCLTNHLPLPCYSFQIFTYSWSKLWNMFSSILFDKFVSIYIFLLVIYLLVCICCERQDVYSCVFPLILKQFILQMGWWDKREYIKLYNKWWCSVRKTLLHLTIMTIQWLLY